MPQSKVGAGRLDRRIRIDRSTATSNDLNEPVVTWATHATVWAGREDATDQESFEGVVAGELGAWQMVNFRIRSSIASRAFTERDRIVYDGSPWNIKRISEAMDGRARYLHILAVRDREQTAT